MLLAIGFPPFFPNKLGGNTYPHPTIQDSDGDKVTMLYKKSANAPETRANATAPRELGTEIELIAPFLPAAALPLPVAAAALPDADALTTMGCK